MLIWTDIYGNCRKSEIILEQRRLLKKSISVKCTGCGIKIYKKNLTDRQTDLLAYRQTTDKVIQKGLRS